MFKIKSFDDCVFELSKLPGIGKKTAMRLALYLLNKDLPDIERLSNTLVNLKKNTRICKKCFGISESDICAICADTGRNNDTICVVEEPKDVFIIEASGRYDGLYHVLGGKIAPLDDIGPDKLRINELIKRVESENINEIIIATNPDIEGETTAIYIKKRLSHINKLLITRIASGIPIGSHLEYADEVTILKSIENRREMR
ncbi:recombination mediator RecR [Deferribacterales bacterium Es71-Z0220]|jgi:recombination protein RecR|uniref:recombination mediator RecR n=1 Tax=Deferrivibrio essentukiensis TaxID=2880922 RepID=UPI001F61279F|nr:recombination mediator RecR [Deferrivibrio essentukiensis]MCB4204052.1 recombination mediator RecR [Deferrivibrio essentukiensis]